MPELAATYHLSPEEVWGLTQAEMTQFLAHHERLVKESRR
jgi:hypothetical protein